MTEQVVINIDDVPLRDSGNGKTFVAMQVVWKLWVKQWPAGRKPRVLYLADRNILVDQPIEREFKPVFAGFEPEAMKICGNTTRR